MQGAKFSRSGYTVLPAADPAEPHVLVKMLYSPATCVVACYVEMSCDKQNVRKTSAVYHKSMLDLV